ncbi:MAG: sulfotransferase [Solirubrobacteraceae bacterium]
MPWQDADSSAVGAARGGRVADGRLPNALVIGSPKAGTTWLFHMLRQHPEVYVSGQDDVLTNVDLGRFVPSTKEPCFFFSRRAMAELGLDGYARTYFAGARDERIVVDNTGGYLLVPRDPPPLTAGADWNPNIPGTVARELGPDVKFIVALREPTDRLISHIFQHRKSAGPRKSRAQIISEMSRLGQLSFGMYHRHLRRWFETFPPSRFFFLVYESDLVTPEAQHVVLGRLAEFLEVAPHAFTGVTDRYNTRQPYRRVGDDYFVVNRDTGGWDLLVGTETVRRFRFIYRDVARETGRLIGRDLTVWEAPRREAATQRRLLLQHRHDTHGARYLFVGGCADSGTAAVCRLLDHDPRIAVAYDGRESLSETESLDLAPEVLLNPTRHERRTLQDEVLLGSLHDRWREGGVRYIGRAFGDLAYRWRELVELAPGSRFVFVLRDLVHLAAAWEARARQAVSDGGLPDPAVAWPAHWNHQTAVETWNAALAAMHAIETEIGRERLFVLDVGALGRPRPRGLEALFAFLELEPDPKVIRRAGSLDPAWVPPPLSAEADGLVAQTRDATLEAWCRERLRWQARTWLGTSDVAART